MSKWFTNGIYSTLDTFIETAQDIDRHSKGVSNMKRLGATALHPYTAPTDMVVGRTRIQATMHHGCRVDEQRIHALCIVWDVGWVAAAVGGYG